MSRPASICAGRPHASNRGLVWVVDRRLLMVAFFVAEALAVAAVFAVWDGFL